MIGERTNEGWELRLRVQGPGRLVGATFLAFWLCGWAVGEAFVLWFLAKGAIALLTGSPPDPGRAPLDAGPALMVGLFLLMWLSLWTIGGIAAAGELLRLLWGEDRILVASGRVTVRWLRGPVRTERTLERHEIRRVFLSGRDDRITLDTERGRVDLSRLGTRTERAEAVTALGAELAIVEAPASVGLPHEWEEIVTPEGQRALVANRATRRRQAQVAGGIALALATLAFVLGRQAFERWDLWIPTGILLAFALGAAAGARWLAIGQWEWYLGSGRLALRKREGSRLTEVFVAQRLLLDVTSDSDGDRWYELSALSDAAPPVPQAITWRTAMRPKNSRSIARVMNDGTRVRELAAWLVRATGLPLDDRTTPEAREVQLAELRTLLENSGRLGRWAGKLVDKLDATRHKTG
jgi:hypothetical protein